jgi:hypothetical protein
MLRWSNLAFGLVFALVSSPLFAQSLHTAPRGTKVGGNFEIGGVHFPLPAGDWVLAGRGETQGREPNGTIARIANAFLIEVSNGKLVRMIFVNAPLRGQGTNTGWMRDRNICDRENTLKNVSDRNFNARDANCFSVNHFVLVNPTNPTEPIKDFIEYLADNKISVPLLRIATEHWLSNNISFLRAQYFFDPEHIGLSAGPSERWDSADWGRTRISTFPEKRAFIDKVEAFAIEIHKELERGLARRIDLGKPTNIQVAGWPVPVVEATPTNTNVAPTDRSPADRLRALEELKAGGLINDGEYQRQRQRILDGM